MNKHEFDVIFPEEIKNHLNNELAKCTSIITSAIDDDNKTAVSILEEGDRHNRCVDCVFETFNKNYQYHKNYILKKIISILHSAILCFLFQILILMAENIYHLRQSILKKQMTLLITIQEPLRIAGQKLILYL